MNKPKITTVIGTDVIGTDVLGNPVKLSERYLNLIKSTPSLKDYLKDMSSCKHQSILMYNEKTKNYNSICSCGHIGNFSKIPKMGEKCRCGHKIDIWHAKYIKNYTFTNFDYDNNTILLCASNLYSDYKIRKYNLIEFDKETLESDGMNLLVYYINHNIFIIMKNGV